MTERSVGGKVDVAVAGGAGRLVPVVGDGARMLEKSFTLARVITMELGRTGLAISVAFLPATAGSVATAGLGRGVVGLTTEADAGAIAFSGRDAGVTEGRNGSVMRPSL